MTADPLDDLLSGMSDDDRLDVLDDWHDALDPLDDDLASIVAECDAWLDQFRVRHADELNAPFPPIDAPEPPDVLDVPPADVVQAPEPSPADGRPGDDATADRPPRPERRPLSRDPAPPTLGEIKAACDVIQSEWSDAERERRIVGPRSGTVTVPVVRSLAPEPRGE